MNYAKRALIGLLIFLNVFTLYLSQANFEVARAAESAEPPTKVLSEAEKEFARIPKSGKVELPELRTRSSKTYLKSDGSKETELYSGDINYLDKRSKTPLYNEINLNFIPDQFQSDSGLTPGYRNAANSFDLKVPKNLNKNIYSLDRGDTKIELSLSPTLKNAGNSNGAIDITNPSFLGTGPTISNNKITYRNVWPSSDLTLYSVATGVKEYINLNKKSGQNVFSFNLKLTNLRIESQSDGSFKLFNATTGKLDSVIPQFVMWDSKGGKDSPLNASSYQISSNLVNRGDHYEITLVADKSWLNAPDRVYPVTIDPSSVYQQDYEDAYGESAFPDTPTWDQRALYLGNTGNYKGLTRTFMMFNLDNLRFARILNATAHVFQYGMVCGSGACPTGVLAYPTTDFNPWDVTWNTQPSRYNATSYVNNGTTWGWLDFDVTSFANAWFNGNDPNLGYGRLAFTTDREDLYGYHYWVSNSHPDWGSQTQNHLDPHISIEYNDYNAEYYPSGDLSGVTGTTLDVPVTVRNTGRNWWGAGNTAISYHLIDSAGRKIINGGPVINLPKDVAPGGDSATVMAQVKVPAMAGDYTIQWDLIQPGITWFSDQGVPISAQKLSATLPSFSSVMHMGSEDYYSKYGPVDLATGSLTFSSSDMSVPTDSGGLAVTRSYNSADVTKKYSQDANGYITKWLLNGLYRDADSQTRLKTNYLGDDANVRPNEGTSSSNNLWFTYDSGAPKVDLNDAFWQNGTAQLLTFENGAGYAHTYVYSPSDRDIQFRLGSDDGARVWLDSQLIFEADYNRPAAPDQDLISSHLSKGWHSLTLKITQGYVDWQLYMRITNTAGQPFADLNYALNNPDIFQASGILGQGWATNLEEKIFGQDQNNIYYRDPSGSINLFAKKASGGYQKPAGIQYELGRDCDGGYNIQYKSGTWKQFDSTGRLIYIEDNRNNYIMFSYNSAGQVIKIYENDRYIDVGYNSNGMLMNVKDQLGTTITYAYDTTISPPRFIGLDYPNNSSHRYAFADTTGYQISRYTDPKGYSTWFKYLNGKVVQINDSVSDVTKFNYLDGKTEVIDPLGRKSSYKFNQVNLLTGFTNAKNYEEMYQYDGNYNLISRIPVVPENSLYYYKYSYSYDDENNLVSESDPLSNTSRYTYSQYFNELTSSTDPKGATEVYAYSTDNKHMLISSQDAKGNVTRYGYNSEWQIAYAEDATGKRTTYTYNSQGQPLTQTTPKGEVVTYTYDALGRKTSEKSPTGKVVTYTYNILSQLTKVADPTGLVITYNYDLDGNQTRQNLPGGKARSYTYDKLGRLIKFTDESGATISYAYDSVGNRIKTTDANGEATTFQFDVLNQMTSRTDPMGNVFAANYDRNGNVSSTQDENGTATTNTYDRAGQLTTSSNSAGSTSLIYDADGNLTSAGHDQTGENVALTYDANGNVTSLGSNATGSNSFSYSNLNQISRSTSGTNSVSYVYDANGQLTQVNNTLTGSGVIGSIILSRDADGKLLSLKKQNGDLSTYTYDPSLRISSLTTVNKLGTTLQNLRYTYDVSSNILAEKDQLINQTKSYTYDIRNQLVSDNTSSYVYDPMGNRQSITTNGRTTSYSYDLAGDANRLMSTTDSLGKATSYQYDKAGDVVKITNATGGVTSNVYDEEGYFIKSTLPDGTSVEYSYDKIANLRTQRKQTNPDGTTSITKFVYDGDKLISETDGTGQVKISYTWDQNENLASFAYTNPNGTISKYYYLKNAKGDIIGFTNTSGRHVVRYSYDSWGKPMKAETLGGVPDGVYTDPSMNPRLFGGYWYDSTLKLYFMKTRMYDPSIGRFLSPDTTISGDTALAYNPYLYCANNPISRIDPNGKSWWSAIAGAVVGAAAAVAAVLCGAAIAVVAAVAVVAGAIAGAAVGAYEYWRDNRGHTNSRDWWRATGRGALNGAAGGAVGGAIVSGVAAAATAAYQAAVTMCATATRLLAWGENSAPAAEFAPISSSTSLEEMASSANFTEHAVDQMANSGKFGTAISQNQVFNTIKVGNEYMDSRFPGQSFFHDPVNNIGVALDNSSNTIVTAHAGWAHISDSKVLIRMIIK